MSRSTDTFRSALLALMFFTPLNCTSVFAQVVGDEAELNRLRIKAEDAMANDDPEGAAMSMGRAALMAVHLAKRDADPNRAKMLRGAEHLFRSQEHGYRALALFRRAGGQLPASTGVCGSLQLAQTEAQQSFHIWDAPSPPGPTDSHSGQSHTELRQTAESWITVLSSMYADFQCAQP